MPTPPAGLDSNVERTDILDQKVTDIEKPSKTKIKEIMNRKSSILTQDNDRIKDTNYNFQNQFQTFI